VHRVGQDKCHGSEVSVCALSAHTSSGAPKFTARVTPAYARPVGLAAHSSARLHQLFDHAAMRACGPGHSDASIVSSRIDRLRVDCIYTVFCPRRGGGSRGRVRGSACCFTPPCASRPVLGKHVETWCTSHRMGLRLLQPLPNVDSKCVLVLLTRGPRMHISSI
jgi:hypothetical protein